MASVAQTELKDGSVLTGTTASSFEIDSFLESHVRPGSSSRRMGTSNRWRTRPPNEVFAFAAVAIAHLHIFAFCPAEGERWWEDRARRIRTERDQTNVFRKRENTPYARPLPFRFGCELFAAVVDIAVVMVECNSWTNQEFRASGQPKQGRECWRHPDIRFGVSGKIFPVERHEDPQYRSHIYR